MRVLSRIRLVSIVWFRWISYVASAGSRDFLSLVRVSFLWAVDPRVQISSVRLVVSVENLVLLGEQKGLWTISTNRVLPTHVAILPKDRVAKLEDGHVEHDIDAIILGSR